MIIERRVEVMPVPADDRQRVQKFGWRMQEFCANTLSYMEEAFKSGPEQDRYGVHYVYNAIKRQDWAMGITCGWALYSVADMIRLHNHCAHKEKIEISPGYGFVLSTKTLKIEGVPRVVLPGKSLKLPRSPVQRGDLWMGSGRVSFYENRIVLSVEVLTHDKNINP